MPDQLRIDPKRYYRQTEEDENVGSLQCCTVAELESFRSSFVGCGRADSFSLLRVPFSHALYESWLGTPSLPSVGFSASQREFLQKTAKEIKVGIGFASPLRYLRFLLFNLFGRGGSPEPPQRSSPSTANMQASTTTDQTDITDTPPSFVIWISPATP